MGEAVARRVFSVNYCQLDRWNVAYFRSVDWRWPKESIRPIGMVLKRIQKLVTTDLVATPIIEKISFGGELTVLDEEKRAGYKGRLFKAESGQLIYSKIRVKQGSVCIVPSSIDWVAVSSEYPVYEIDLNEADPKYLELVLRSSVFKHYLDGLSHGGSTKTRIHPNQFEDLAIPIPPLPIQQKIVAHWEAANSKANADMTASQELAQSTPSLLVSKIGLKALVSPHSRRAFVSSWNEIERWGVELAREMSRRPNIEISPFPVVALSDVIADLQNGWSPKCLTRPAIGDEWGVLKVGAVSFGWFDERQNKALPPSMKPREQYEVKPGDLIISRANIARYVGACALVEKVRPKLMLCDKLFRVVWKEESPVLPKYLDEIFKIPHLRWQIENNLTGASPTMKNISKPALMALRFPLPPLEIQEEIISEIEEKRKEARNLQNDARVSQKQAGLEIETMILGTRPVEVR